MGFTEVYSQYQQQRWRDWEDYSPRDIERALASQHLNVEDLRALLAPAARQYLEQMADRARQLTLQYFGRAVVLYAPLYVSNYCTNTCTYCSFSRANLVGRQTLNLDQVAREAEAIAAQGIRHILVLTGESRREAPVAYLEQCVTVLKRYFVSIGLEVYPLETAEYRRLVASGVDGLTVYQEVYDQDVFRQVHPAGPKRDFAYRLATAERACQAGMYRVNIGALLGLAGWRQEVFWVGLHAAYLHNNYPESEISVSVPRLRPFVGGFQQAIPVNERELVQIVLALRLFLPRVGITLSTRERATVRDHMLGLGVTRLSAGSSTSVGGYTLAAEGEGQFEIADCRSVAEICQAVRDRGFDPVLKDWHLF